jgi:hypothetical protein
MTFSPSRRLRVWYLLFSPCHRCLLDVASVSEKLQLPLGALYW